MAQDEKFASNPGNVDWTIDYIDIHGQKRFTTVEAWTKEGARDFFELSYAGCKITAINPKGYGTITAWKP